MSSGRKTAIGIGVLLAVAVGSVIALVQLGGGGGEDQAGTGSESAAETTPVTRAPPPTTGEPINYQIQRGDTLTSIADQFNVTTAAIIEANEFANPDQLTEGAILVIPPAPPVELVITPLRIRAGETAELTLTGAKPSETVAFAITSPAGTFTGPPHAASEEGTVMTTYTPDRGAPEGVYKVVALGDEGTIAEAAVQVNPADF